MLDLETLSSRKDAAVFQVAALCFDPETGETGPAFNAFVRPQDVHGHVDVGTVAWWMGQLAAGSVSRRWQNDSCKGLEVLSDFGEWLAQVNALALWSHGATFDIVVQENQYTARGLPKPWSYRIERDTRTLYALAYADAKPPAFPGNDAARVHDAEYDCEVQAWQVTQAWGVLASNRRAAAELITEAVHAAAADTLTGYVSGAHLDTDPVG
jgi:exodeoxyribonuclease VIII